MLTREESLSLSILYLYVDRTDLRCSTFDAMDVRNLSIVCVEWLRTPPNPISSRAWLIFSRLFETSSTYRFCLAEQERFLRLGGTATALFVKTSDLLWPMGGANDASPPILYAYDSYCLSVDSYLQLLFEDAHCSMPVSLGVAPVSMIPGCPLSSLFWDSSLRALCYDCMSLRGLLHWMSAIGPVDWIVFLRHLLFPGVPYGGSGCFLSPVIAFWLRLAYAEACVQPIDMFGEDCGFIVRVQGQCRGDVHNHFYV